MYVLKNALKCIGRAKGRNILIGIIALVIAVSACIGLCIRQAAETAREDTLAGLTVTATISFDRQSMMNQMRPSGNRDATGTPPGTGEGGFDREQFSQIMNTSGSLTLEEYQTYAAADSVADFYYALSALLNGSENFQPVSNESESASEDTEDEESDNTPGQMTRPGGMDFGNRGQMMMGAQSDFVIVGYSSDSAMTSFADDGTASVTSGKVFEEGTSALECIIPEELAVYNDIVVGDEVALTNPNNEEEVYTFTVVGIYTDTAANQDSFSFMGSTSSDAANRIYTSYNALKSVVDSSEEVATTKTDENTGREYNTNISGTLAATYVFDTADDYYRFEEDVRTLGLSDSYTVSSANLTAFENSLIPLTTLSTMAGYFLLVILLIGAIILIVLNIFNVRERKYEIGVLTAMGMKKSKVALQFLTEIFIVTLVAVIIGAGIGAACASPVANALLQNQIASQSSQMEQTNNNFGREQNMGMGGGMRPSGNMQRPNTGEMPELPTSDGFTRFGNTAVGAYIDDINSVMNLTVVLQLLGIAVLLTLVAGLASMLFVMRYDPLKILSNRD